MDADTIVLDSTRADHSPMRAAMYSAVLPGLGQVYNNKYWKLPIVYGGLVGLGYSAVWNSRQYNYYRDLYKYMTENGLDEFENRSLNEVQWYKDTHLRYKNLMIILTVGFYALQIVDASVDAHLIDYDISDDISFTLDPVFLNTGSPMVPGLIVDNYLGRPGIRCCLKF